jgi:hypothetical protein
MNIPRTPKSFAGPLDVPPKQLSPPAYQINRQPLEIRGGIPSPQIPFRPISYSAPAIQRKTSAPPIAPTPIRPSVIQPGRLGNLFTSLADVNVTESKSPVPNRRAGHLGIGEKVILSLENPSLHRDMHWVQTQGTGTLTPRAVNGSVTYQAAAVAENVVLQLQDSTNHVHKTFNYVIVAPKQELEFSQVQAIKTNMLEISGGFRATVRMGPGGVSFSNVEITEDTDSIPNKGDGIFAGLIVPHPPSTAWGTATRIAVDGTLFNCNDTVSLERLPRGSNPKLVGSAYGDKLLGSLHRFIKWKYRIKGKPQTYDWCVAHSQYHVWGDGTTVRVKGGKKVSVDLFGNSTVSSV